MNDRIRSISRWTAALGFGATMLFASSAHAHGDRISASCTTGLVIDLANYDATNPNTITASIDGSQLVSTSFGSTYSATLPFGDPFVAHTYRVVVKAWDDPTGAIGWTFDTGLLGIAVCAEATTTTATTTTTTTLVAIVPPLPSSSVAPAPAPATTFTVPAAAAPPPSAVAPSVVPGPTVIVAQASPPVTVASEAPPVPTGALPVTGSSNAGFIAAGLIAGGLGLLATAMVRRSARS